MTENTGAYPEEPENLESSEDETILKTYNKVINNEEKFPDNYFSEGDIGIKRAVLCFKYLCEVLLEVSFEMIPKVFLGSDSEDILSESKLDILFPHIFRTVFDLVATAYPDTMGPAYFMEGVELANGWKVLKRYVAASKKHSGGYFSVGYLAQASNGNNGFLKAIDYNWAFKSNDPSRDLQIATSAYNFERDVLEICKEARMNRIVKSITYGTYRKRGSIIPVDYMIFERADGDVRDYIEYTDNFNYGWALRCLHNVSVGLSQLHTNGLAHQDLKPSNVLVFEGNESKIGDLGRAVRRGVPSPHERLIIAGDSTYAPPELLYSEVDPDWSKYRIGCDAYMLGSLTMFIFSQINMTAALKSIMNPDHWRDRWGGSFRDVLPYVREAFNVIMKRFEEALPEVLRESLTTIVRELCEPDPVRRATQKGIPRTGTYYTLRPYVSKFNEMARKVELGIWRIN